MSLYVGLKHEQQKHTGMFEKEWKKTRVMLF